MRGLSGRLEAANVAIDAANANDPTAVVVRGVASALALAHGRLAAEWVQRLVPSADDALLLAARAHHLRRWEVARSRYPEGRAGYLRWRTDQKARHAVDVEAILHDAGYDAASILRVQALIRRDDLKTDPDAQVLEDAACLVFLETQLSAMSARLDHVHLIDVIRKTSAKMSATGILFVAELPLDDATRALLGEALG